MLLFLSLMSPAEAGRFDPGAPQSLGSGWVYTGLGVSSYTTEFWAGAGSSQSFELPAAWSTSRVDLIGEVGLGPHLAVGAAVPWVDSTALVRSEPLCESYKMCDDVRSFGDLRVSLRSPWQRGPWTVTGRLELASGFAYQDHIDDLGAPGDGNTDLIIGAMAGRGGALGPMAWKLSGGAEWEQASGRPPNALSLGTEGSLRWLNLELGLAWQLYNSIGGLSFGAATTTDRMENDPGRFTDIGNDFQLLAPRLSVYAGAHVGVHAGAWWALAVESGPKDNSGANLGISYWW